MSRKARRKRVRNGKSSRISSTSIITRKKIAKRGQRKTALARSRLGEALRLAKRTRALVRKRSPARTRQAAKLRRRSPRLQTLKADPQAEAAVLEMNRGRSLTAAARDSQLTRGHLLTYVTRRRLARRKGRRWVSKDNRLRRVPVMTGGRFRILTVRGYESARLVGEHHHAAGEFVRRNDINVLGPFRGQSVQTVSGRRYLLETDPNALHRIAAMDSPPFHEIYEITSNS
jgi:hypothetical protein